MTPPTQLVLLGEKGIFVVILLVGFYQTVGHVLVGFRVPLTPEMARKPDPLAEGRTPDGARSSRL